MEVLLSRVSRMQLLLSPSSLCDDSERSAMVEIPNVDDKAASMVVVRPTILQMIDSEEIQTTIGLKFDKNLQETKERPVGERALRKRRKSKKIAGSE